MRVTPGGRRQLHRTGHERHVRAGLARRGRDGESHFSRSCGW